MTPTEPRQWQMWAGDVVRNDQQTFVHASQNRRYPEMYGTPPVRVLATEDPNGRYWAWLPMMDRASGEPVVDAYPVFVYDRESLLAMCFPYGYANEEKLGRGRLVRLSIDLDPTEEA
jgi:hypothetical protein